MILSHGVPVLKHTAVVLGMFDGVHLGHQRLFAAAAETGCQVVACTFDPHPLTVLCPGKPRTLLTTVRERAYWMEKYGVHEMVLLPFDSTVAEVSADSFLSRLVRDFEPVWIVAGYNYSFGAGGKGNAETIRKAADRYGYRAMIVPPVTVNGEVVSSTRIRTLLEKGDQAGACALLGHAVSAYDINL